MKKVIKIIFSILMLINITGCNKKTNVDVEIPFREMNSIQKKIDKMTLEEKVGMLFIIRPDALDFSLTADDLANNSIQGSIAVTDTMKENYEKYPAGGFALFKKNIVDEKQLIEFTKQLHSLGNYYPLTCIDEEGGMVARIANHDAFDVKDFPNMEDIALTKDTNNAYDLGKTIGEYLEKYGLDVDFAPVSDVNTNPNNTVIGARAFGSDPELASLMVEQVVKGLHDSNTMSCIKHFPGHGDTNEDTHYGYAQTNKTWEEMNECEMIPFKKGIEAGTDMVMVAHITATQIENGVPATLSHTLLTDKLRNELGYDGVIITDSFAMGAVTQEYSSGEAAVKAIQAGVDIVLMPENYIEAFNAVKEAVLNSTISEERINESVFRILRLRSLNK